VAVDLDLAGSAKQPQVIRDQPIGSEAVSLKKFARQFQRGVPAFYLNQFAENLKMATNSGNEVARAAPRSRTRCASCARRTVRPLVASAGRYYGLAIFSVSQSADKIL